MPEQLPAPDSFDFDIFRRWLTNIAERECPWCSQIVDVRKERGGPAIRRRSPVELSDHLPPPGAEDGSTRWYLCDCCQILFGFLWDQGRPGMAVAGCHVHPEHAGQMCNHPSGMSPAEVATLSAYNAIRERARRDQGSEPA